MFIIIVAIIITSIVIVGMWKTSTSYFCSHNPDKCVCEEQITKYNPFSGAKYSVFKHTETIISPFEIPYYSGIRYDHNYKNWCSKFRLKTPSELLIDDCNSNPREDDKCKCEEYPEVTGSWSSCDGTRCYAGYSIGKGNQTQHISKLLCIKSRPKTECEKGNPDWVEKIQCKTPIQNTEICFENQTICREKTK